MNSNAAVNINLGSNAATGGYAEGDILNDIVNVIGSNYNDTLLGNNEDNILTGGNGNDTLTAGIGNDTLTGGNGIDKFIITTEITTATISDFDVSNDTIDLRLFNSFNSLQSIRNATRYINGNSVVSLSNSKSLILNGVNYNDLQESNFFIITLSPTQIPTAMPSLSPTSVPTLPPTAIPSYSPTQTPTAPTAAPTTSSPTFNPTASPTTIPTAIPTQYPSFAPTATPSQIPTNMPTASPTAFPTPGPTGLYSTTIDIIIGNSSPGTSASENFKIDSPLAVSVTGNGGLDKFTIYPHPEVTYTITDFDQKGDRIDLQLCNVYEKSELMIVTNPAGFVLITLPDSNQQLKLLNLQAEDITFGNFIFTSTQNPTPVPTPDPTHTPTLTPTSPAITDTTLIAAAIGTAIGATLLGGGAFLYNKLCNSAYQTTPEETSDNLGAPTNKIPYSNLVNGDPIITANPVELMADGVALHVGE